MMSRAACNALRLCLALVFGTLCHRGVGERTQLERDVAYADFLIASPAAHARFRATMDEDRLSRAEIFRYNEEFVARAAAAVGATTYSVRLNEFADMLPHELKQRLAPAAASAGVAAARAALPAATDTPAREEAPPPTRVDWSAFTLPAAGDLDVPSSLHVATAASVISGPAAGGSAGEGAAPRRVDPMWLMYCTACADAGDLGCLLAFLATTPRLCTTADCDAQCDADIRGVSVVGGEPRDLRAAVARAPVVAAVRAATPGFLLYNDGVYE